MGLDCLLISTNLVASPYPVYPLGLAHLAGALRQAGHRPAVFDLLAGGGLDGLQQHLREAPPSGLIGLSIRNLDTVDSTLPVSFLNAARQTMALVRALSTAPVVVGGPAFSLLPAELMDLLKPDYGVVGEGEAVLPWLAGRIEQGRPPAPGLLRPDRPVSLPFPVAPVAYDQQISSHYLNQGGMLNIQSKRGCPHRCGYCPYPVLEGRRVRTREPLAVAGEVKRLAEDLGARYLFFTDAVFNDQGGHYLAVAEALVRTGNRTPWCAYFRPQGLSRETLRLLKRAGLAAMEFGTDAASDTTLAGLNKGFTFSEAISVNALAAALDIACGHFIIFGGPGETEQTLQEGLDNIEKLSKAVVFGFAGIRILPRTAVHELALAQGMLAPEQSLLNPVYYFSPRIEQARQDALLRAAWHNRDDRIYPPSMLEQRVRQLHRHGHAGPAWDLLLRFAN